MSRVLLGAQFFVFAAALFVLVGAVVAALARSLSQRWLLTLHPASRYRALFAITVAPLAVGALLLVVACLPAILSLVFPLQDHCLRHDDVHAHLCFVHLPQLVHVNVGLVLAVWAAACVGAVRFITSVGKIIAALRVSSQLIRSASHDPTRDFFVLETGMVSVAVGLFAPRIFISRGLLGQLSREQLDIVLAHERAHTVRRDPLMQLLARVFLAFHFAPVRRWLADELAVSAEQACDEAAATSSGDRLAVAETILSVAKSCSSGPPRELALAMGETAIERRVDALLNSPAPEFTGSLFTLGVCSASLMLLGAAQPIHHCTEAFLSLFVE